MVILKKRERLMNKAFEILARRGQAEKELKTKLLKKFPNCSLIEKIIKRLKELGYLNDEKFTREWIESRIRTKPRGRILIRRELLTKGVKAELVEKILELVYNREREKKELRELFSFKRKRYSPDRQGRNKLVSYLLRRGFLWEDIKDNLESEE